MTFNRSNAPGGSRLAGLLAVLLLVMAGTWNPAAGEKVTLTKSVAASGKKLDKTKFAGRVIAYDDDGFELRVKADEVETIAWKDLDARTYFAIRRSLINPKDATAQVELGRDLLGVEGGREWSEKAFAAAMKIDPGTKASIEQIKKDAPGRPAGAKKGEDGAKPDVNEPSDTGDTGDKPEMGAAEGRVGPETIGEIQKQFWGKQSDAQQAAAVATLKEFADEAQKRTGKSLTLKETKYFLFYSNIDPTEARNWSGLLDRMYVKLADLFGVEKDVNIWRGKALVFVFKTQGEYVKFEQLMHQTPARGSAGLCHTYGDGMVHIAFYRQDKELEFAHVLVHESVHGFVHRYKSPARVPSWANEGLAETIATQLVPEQNRQKNVRYAAQYYLNEYRGLKDFFDAEHIEGWQYPVAEMMTTFLIEKNRRGYVAFINGIKEGLGVDDAMNTRLKWPREQMVPVFGQALGVKLAG